MSSCHSCGGIIGRDCWNPQECAEITERMAMEATQPDPDPSPTNTAGLEVVAWEARLKPDGDWYPITLRYVEARQKDDAFDVRPHVVTAASAQARIAELEAELEREKSKPRWSVAEFNAITENIIKSHAEEVHRAQAAEARADRLAGALKRLSERLCDTLERLYATDAEWVKAEYPNGVTENLVITAALQQKPTT